MNFLVLGSLRLIREKLAPSYSESNILLHLILVTSYSDQSNSGSASEAKLVYQANGNFFFRLFFVIVI